MNQKPLYLALWGGMYPLLRPPITIRPTLVYGITPAIMREYQKIELMFLTRHYQHMAEFLTHYKDLIRIPGAGSTMLAAEGETLSSGGIILPG